MFIGILSKSVAAADPPKKNMPSLFPNIIGSSDNQEDLHSWDTYAGTFSRLVAACLGIYLFDIV